MKQAEFVVGARVRIARHLGGPCPGGSYDMAPGPVGTVVMVNHDATVGEGEPSDIFAQVKLDVPSDDYEVREHHDNCIAVWRHDSLQDSVPADYALA